MSGSAGNPVLAKSLRWGAIFTVILAAVTGTLGFLLAGPTGLWGALLGAGLAFIFLGLTAGSILLGRRLTVDDPLSPVFYGVVLGSWVLKLVLFVLFMIWLRGQTWFDPMWFGVTVVVAVIGSLVIDALAMIRTRVPYVDVALPEASAEDAAGN
ncbi:MAG: hypothetical protein DI534_02465 [Leifsonia xyli]|nr:MAG: hypothetical protein DI534_02465 [Leifsonia xyli]